SFNAATSRSLIRIEPSKPPSSRPTACSKVDLPEPDGPSKATISPGWTARFTPRSTWISTSPCTKLRRRSATASTSFIAQHLHRIGLRRAPGGNEGGDEAHDQGHGDDHRHLDRIHPRRQLGQEADLRIPQILAGQPLKEIDDRLAEIEAEEAERQAGEDTEHANAEPDRHEDLHHPAARGPHRPE